MHGNKHRNTRRDKRQKSAGSYSQSTNLANTHIIASIPLYDFANFGVPVIFSKQPKTTIKLLEL
jgi:hypothetical protein